MCAGQIVGYQETQTPNFGARLSVTFSTFSDAVAVLTFVKPLPHKNSRLTFCYLFSLQDSPFDAYFILIPPECREWRWTM